jgi:hypothetical protein
MHDFLKKLWIAIWPWIDAAQQVLSSWLGKRIEVAAAAALMLVISFYIAHSQRQKIMKDFAETKKRGARPTTQPKLDEWLAEFEKDRLNNAFELGYAALLVALFGFVIPSTLMGLGVYEYNWFFPKAHALMSVNCGKNSPNSLSYFGTAIFVTSQFFMGFGQHLDEIIPHQSTLAAASALEPADSVIAAALILYRYFVGAFSLMFVQLISRAYAVRRMVGPVEKLLDERKQKLAAASRG